MIEPPLATPHPLASKKDPFAGNAPKFPPAPPTVRCIFPTVGWATPTLPSTSKQKTSIRRQCSQIPFAPPTARCLSPTVGWATPQTANYQQPKNIHTTGGAPKFTPRPQAPIPSTNKQKTSIRRQCSQIPPCAPNCPLYISHRWLGNPQTANYQQAKSLHSQARLPNLPPLSSPKPIH